MRGHVNEYSPTAAQVDNNLSSCRWLGKELTNDDINCSEPQPVASIDKWCPSLEFADKETKEMRLVGVVEALDTALGGYAPIIGLDVLSNRTYECNTNQRIGFRAATISATTYTHNQIIDCLRLRGPG